MKYLHSTPKKALGVIVTLAVIATSVACAPSKLPQSKMGRTGLPAGVVDSGNAPKAWEFEADKLPIYTGAEPYKNWRNYITGDKLSDVVKFYDELSSDESVEKTRGKGGKIIFKHPSFIITVYRDKDDENTLIFFDPAE